MGHVHKLKAQWMDVTEQFLVEASTQASWFGTGMSAADFNLDGLEDLTFCNSDGTVVAYAQLAEGGFEEVYFIPGTAAPQGIVWFDADGDDDLDLLISRRFGAMEFFVREDDELIESAAERGIPISNEWEPRGLAVADYDEDGDLDVYVSMYHDGTTGLAQNLLLNNDGFGHFTDVAEMAGVGNGIQHTFQAVWFDHDADGDLDLWVINDREVFPNALYENLGDGTFLDVGPQVGAAQSIFGMTATIGDPDNDGEFELFCTNVENLPNLYLDKVNSSYVSIAPAVGLDGMQYSWGGFWVDADGDMWSDLAVATYRFPNALPYDNYFYKNIAEGLLFEDQTEAAWPNEQTQLYCVAGCDFNGDLAPDLVGFGNMPYVQMLENMGLSQPNSGGRLAVQLCGTESNQWAIGAEVRVHAGGLTQLKSITCGSDYMTQQSWRLFFGLGTADFADSITVSWPSGMEEVWYEIPEGTNLRLVEGTSTASMEVSGTNCPEDSAWWVFPFDAPYRTVDGVPVFADSVLLEPGLHVAECRWMDGLFSWADTIDWSILPPHIVTLEWTEPHCHGEPGTLGWVADSAFNVLLDGEVYAPVLLGSDHPAGILTIATHDPVSGCLQEHVFDLSEPAPLALYIEYVPPACSEDTVQAFAAGFGGTPGYLVNWNGADPSNLEEGEVMLELTDANECALDSSFFVVIPEPITFDVQVVHEDEGFDASIALDIAGGTAPYNVLWNNGEEGDTVLSGLSTGLFSWVVQDANGCIAMGLQEIINLGLTETPWASGWEFLVSERGLGVRYSGGIVAPGELQIMDFTGRVFHRMSIQTESEHWIPWHTLPEHGIVVITDRQGAVMGSRRY